MSGRGSTRIAVAAAVAACGMLVATVASCGSTSSGPAAAAFSVQSHAGSSALGSLRSTLAADGTSIVVGDAKAPTTVKVYEDPRCPYCKKAEQAAGPVLADLAAQGKIKIEYTIASFLDQRLGGTGSAAAANALRASVEAGQFPAFHAALYANQPTNESVDLFTSANLLKIAETVPGLDTAAFRQAVKNRTYQQWVKDSQDSYTGAGLKGTPTIQVNGKDVAPEGAMYNTTAFNSALQALL
ncbi:DsbA family protein [Streptacidiphilus sp. PAMC 29251]